jgi:hypothetical protein
MSASLGLVDESNREPEISLRLDARDDTYQKERQSSVEPIG